MAQPKKPNQPKPATSTKVAGFDIPADAPEVDAYASPDVEADEAPKPAKTEVRDRGPALTKIPSKRRKFSKGI
jgi:hypothetical protein